MLLVQPVITFSHRHFFCVSALFITDSQLFIFSPLLSSLPLLLCLFIFSLLVLFFICPLFISPSLFPVFPDHLSDQDKGSRYAEDQTLSRSPEDFGQQWNIFTPFNFLPTFAPADFSALPSSCHKPPQCLFCYRMRNKNVVPLLLLIYLLCLGE